MFKFKAQYALGFFISFMLMGPAFVALSNVSAITPLIFFFTVILFVSVLVKGARIKVRDLVFAFYLACMHIITIFQNMFIQYTPQIPNGVIYLTVNSLLFLLLFLCGNEKTIDALFKGLRFFGIILSSMLIFPLFLATDYRSIYPAGFGVWLTLGLAAGISSTAWLAKLDYEIINNDFRWSTNFFTMVSLLGVLFSLGRGALLFIGLLTVGLLFRLLIHKGFVFVLIRYVPLVIILLFVIFAVIPEMQIARLANLVGSNSDVGARVLIYYNVLSKLPDMAWHGFGIGYFFPFPHNFALHIFAELGIIGILWILTFYLRPLFVFTRRFFRKHNTVAITSSFYLIGFLLLEFSKSHNAYNARALFIGCAVLIISLRTNRTLT